LNSLDGVGTGDGIVVVATANEPTLLDPAILRRPGRFDRVVQFANPSAELRLRYLLKFNSAIGAQALEQPVAESDGFSFAQLREAVILAAQPAFERKADIDADDLLHAVRTLRQTTVRGSVHSKFAGFDSPSSAE
jgi:ATP-dependent 26S proteasome regulatory subunit